MLAMTLPAIGQPLVPQTRPRPEPGPGEVRLAVRACAVCRTDLHVVDGELPPASSPTPIAASLVQLSASPSCQISDVTNVKTPAARAAVRALESPMASRQG